MISRPTAGTTLATGTTEFAYDPNGHLLSEQKATGSGRDYVWTDTSPIAQINVNGSNQANDTIDYLHTDAMGTPRLASDANQQIVWRWKWDAFGDRQVKASNTLIEMNLRYPGQYYDTETGLFYNWNRYYDPSTGRYGRSDPIGLNGGASTFTYVSNNPISYFDPRGLVKWSGSFGGFAAIDGFGAGIFTFDLTSECKCHKKINIKGLAFSIAGGFGAKAAKYTGTDGSSTFHDFKDCPDPDVATGPFALMSASSVPGGGFSLSKITLGHLFSNAGFGEALGFDMSAGVFFGQSIVTSYSVQKCCNE